MLGKDSCNGDSGGLLIKRTDNTTPWFLVGVVSFGTSKCGSGTPGRLQNFILNDKQVCTNNFLFQQEFTPEYLLLFHGLKKISNHRNFNHQTYENYSANNTCLVK